MAELAEFEDIQTVYALLLLKKHLSDKKTWFRLQILF
jgi:hypothetical protein